MKYKKIYSKNFIIRVFQKIFNTSEFIVYDLTDLESVKVKEVKNINNEYILIYE